MKILIVISTAISALVVFFLSAILLSFLGLYLKKPGSGLPCMLNSPCSKDYYTYNHISQIISFIPLGLPILILIIGALLFVNEGKTKGNKDKKQA